MSEVTLSEILKEIRELKKKVESLKNLVRERLTRVDNPLPDEIEAIENYEQAKKTGTVKFVKLEDIQE
ncbi:MAG: hypothetical protein ACP6IU_12595 [Candidatus Asgardarchaeia archaeon]